MRIVRADVHEKLKAHLRNIINMMDYHLLIPKVQDGDQCQAYNVCFY